MQRALQAKAKIGFINGSLPRPDPTDSLFSIWERCNDMVVSWLHNSIAASLRPSMAFVDDAYDIWNELQDRFKKPNKPKIYELKKALSNTISVYYGKLKAIWDELSIYDPLTTCTCENLKTRSNRYKRDCVIQFLKGLNYSYSNIRVQVMLMEPLPAVNKFFSYI